MRVKVAGIYPLRIEWDRSSMDFTTWEAQFMKCLCSMLERSKVFIDVGAAVGEWSALAATIIGSEHVHIIEPNLPCWGHIKNIFFLNRLPPPGGMFPGFAADTDSFQLTLFSSIRSHKWPLNVKGEAKFEYLFASEGMPKIKLDTYCRLLSIVPYAVKIDVEGAEGIVLRGFQESLVKHNPLIFLSLHPFAVGGYGDSKNGILEWMRSLGYHDLFLATSHEEHWLLYPDKFKASISEKMSYSR